MVFVVQSMLFENRIGKINLNCHGVFEKWEDAFTEALNNMDCLVNNETIGEICTFCSAKDFMWKGAYDSSKEWVCSGCIELNRYPCSHFPSKNIKLIYPNTEEELRKLLPKDGFVREFELGNKAVWCDGDFLFSVSMHEIKLN